MSDLIERQAAKDACLSCLQGENTLVECPDECDAVVYGSVELIEQLPSAQPEIIRCKDCKHWDTTWQNDLAKNYHYCLMTDGTHRSDWYCADAERRTDG